jgi:putative membrane protein
VTTPSPAPAEPPRPGEPALAAGPSLGVSPAPPGYGQGHPAIDGTSWHRLHPLTPVVRAGTRVLSLIAVLLGISLFRQGQDNGQLVGDLVIIALALSGGFISWLVTRWQVADGVLRIETGLIRRDSRRFPLTQIQAIDVVQSGLARVLGLAELQLRVAGSDSSRGGRLASLRLADAEALRRELLAASASAATTEVSADLAGAAPPPGNAAVTSPGALPGPEVAAGSADVPERMLFRVQPGRLAAAIIMSRSGAIALVVIAGLATIVAVSGGTGAIASFLPAALGIVLTVWRQFNSEYATRVAAAPDGLRLRSGLIQTTAETIRPGRVQGVRLVEPMLWRPFGWCRLEVDVAGPKERRENKSAASRLRGVIPVGSRAEVEAMLGELMSSHPLPDRRPPRQARFKAPLLYHFLAWGGNDDYVVAARGRIRRTTTWVPLEKVQSLRWVQGPVQRRLGLASVRLDVAGRRVNADIEDRSAGEASDLLTRMTALARDARARDASARGGAR